MMINEAVNLVIYSAFISENNDLFLLDMGKPVNILELANQIIKLSGKTIKDEINKNGEIEIVFTGLREGEKLFEELLINGECKSTSNPKIFTLEENFIKYSDLIPK